MTAIRHANLAVKFARGVGVSLPRRRGRRRIRAVIESMERRILLSTVVVNSTNDQFHNPSSGIVSIRDAIERANRSLSSISITFDAAVFAHPRRIVLGSELELRNKKAALISITGPSAGVTLSGGGNNRILLIDPGVNVAFTGLTLTDGLDGFASYNGGAINNHGKLTITSSVITGNQSLRHNGGGIENYGELAIRDSTISDNTAPFGYSNGGGIVSSGTLTLTDCTIAGNSCQGDGGAIYNSGVATLTRCTLSGNHAYVNAGEFGYPAGGAIDNPGTLTLTDSTVADNTSDESGGGIENSGTAVITNSTVTGNSGWFSGGVFNEQKSNLSLANSIVAQNTALPPSNNLVIFAPDIGGSIKSLGHNLIGKTDGSNGWTKTDLTGTDAHPLDPRLSALDFLGGPTKTEFPLSGSPAIGSGNPALVPATVATDQRGFARVTDGMLDIGAVQLQRCAVVSITPPAKQNVVAAADTTIRLGSFADTAAKGPYRVVVNWGDGSSNSYFDVPAPGPISTKHAFILPGTLTGTAYVVDRAGDISRPARFSISASRHSPIAVVVNSTADRLDAPGSATVTLRDAVQIADFSVGAVSIVFDPLVFAKPQAIALHNSFLDLTHNIFGPISITAHGALILAGDGTNCILSIEKGITAAVRGLVFIDGGNSAIINNGALNVSRCTIARSRAHTGGGINNAGDLTLVDSTVSGNLAFSTGYKGSVYPAMGAGIYSPGTLVVTGCTISNNLPEDAHYPQDGGAGIFSLGALTIANSVISGNSGGGVVDGIYPFAGPLVISESRITNNEGIGVSCTGSFTLSSCNISGNKNLGGGAGAVLFSGDLTNCTISDNTAKYGDGRNGDGGGLVANGSITLTNCTVSDNVADQSGGGIFIESGAMVTLNDTTISANAAMRGGGVFCSTSNTTPPATVANTIIAANSLSSGGSDADVSGAFISLGHNLVGQTNGSSGWITSDLKGTSTHPLNVKLSPLGNHGGPTKTQIPLAGSPAIGAGSVALIPKGITTDQRGKPRVVNGKVDIGAVEVQST